MVGKESSTVCEIEKKGEHKDLQVQVQSDEQKRKLELKKKFWEIRNTINKTFDVLDQIHRYLESRIRLYNLPYKVLVEIDYWGLNVKVQLIPTKEFIETLEEWKKESKELEQMLNRIMEEIRKRAGELTSEILKQ